MRGYLWECLHQDVAEQFAQLSDPKIGVMWEDRSTVLGPDAKWTTPDPAEDLINTWDWRRHRSKSASTGILPRRPRSTVRRGYGLSAAKEILREMREEKKRKSMREKLKDTRVGPALHFTILNREEHEDGTHSTHEVDGYVHTGEYEDGRLGEIFVKVGKAGSNEAMYDQWAILASIGLQHGIPVDVLFSKHVGTRFKPSGTVKGAVGIRNCTSILDLISRWLIGYYGSKENAQ